MGFAALQEYSLGFTPTCLYVLTSQLLYGALRNFSVSAQINMCDLA